MRCPQCKKPVTKVAGDKLYPFCSERCHLVDLGRWLGEEYKISGEPEGSTSPAATTTDED